MVPEIPQELSSVQERYQSYMLPLLIICSLGVCGAFAPIRRLGIQLARGCVRN